MAWRFPVTSGRNTVRRAAARFMAAAKAYAAPMLHRETIAAARNGPTNSPIRKVPPRVERARARIRMGMASVR
jgi:hypothetical protein